MNLKQLGLILIITFLILVGVHFLLAPKSDEFVESDMYDEIIHRGKIKVGINTSIKPFGFINEKGEFDGYDVELAKYIAQYIVKNRNAVEFVPVSLNDRLIKASTGEVDMVISTITITPQREEIVGFSIPYDIAGQAILVKKNSSITSLTDLAGENVGVIFGTTAEKNIKNLVPSANMIGFRDYDEAYESLKAGKINAITSDDTILCRYSSKDASVKILPKRYSREPYGIAFKKGYSTVKLKEHLDFAISDLQRKNVIPRLRKSWGIGV